MNECPHRCLSRHAGFTLLELMITVVIAAVLLAIALPDLGRFLSAAARAKGATELYAALNQARSESVARNVAVTVCRRDFYTASPFPQCAIDSGTWSQGWIVYQDSTGLFADTEPDRASDVIAVFDPVGATTPTRDDAFRILTTTLAPTHITFMPNGRSGEVATFTLCENGGRLKDARLIEVALSGRVSLSPLAGAEAAAACPSP